MTKKHEWELTEYELEERKDDRTFVALVVSALLSIFIGGYAGLAGAGILGGVGVCVLTFLFVFITTAWVIERAG